MKEIVSNREVSPVNGYLGTAKSLVIMQEHVRRMKICIMCIVQISFN